MSQWTRRRVLGSLSGAALFPLGPVAAWASDSPVELEGFSFEPTVQLAGAKLLLNGAAVSSILSVRTNVVALYLPRRTTTPEACGSTRCRSACGSATTGARPAWTRRARCSRRAS